MIGTNRDLKSIARHLDWRIVELGRLADGAADPAWIAGQLAILKRERLTVSTILANRRLEAANKVVDLSRWFSGNGVLLDGARRAGHRDAAAALCGHTRSGRL